MKKIILLLTSLFLFQISFGQATLSVSTTTLDKSNLPTGFSHSGLGTNYSGPKLKFDTNNDTLILFFNAPPGDLTFDLGTNNNFTGNFPAGYVFTIKESVDGITYTTVTTYTDANIKGTQTITNLNTNSRYVKWVYTTKPSGFNTALWNINLNAANATDSYAIAPTTQIGGGTINSIVDTSAEAVDVFKIEIQDSGLVDNLNTTVTSLKLKPGTNNTADWTDFIQGLVFNNGSITPLSINITDNFIDVTFNSGDLIVLDNDSIYLTLSVYLNTTNILDNKIISFKVDKNDHGFTADISGSTFANSFSNDISSNDFTIDVNATELQITQQPTNILINTVMSPNVTVYYIDENGNRDYDYDSLGATATLSAIGATLAATTTTAGTPINGILTFSDIEFSTFNAGVTLTITDNAGITNNIITSNSFNVLGAPLCNITTGIVIASQDFEDIPATPTLTYNATNVYPSSGQGAFPTADLFASGLKGVKINGASGTINFDQIDTSKYENIEFSMRVASFSGTSGNGCDSGDFILIKIHNGTYSKEIKIKGNTNNRWSFTSGTGIASTVYDGDDTEINFQPSTNGAVTTEGYSTIKITNLPAISNLRIQIKAYNNSSDEIWVLDDAILKGDQKDFTTWNNVTKTWSNGAPNATTKAFFDTSYNMLVGGSTLSIKACECEIKTNKTVTINNNKYLEIGNDIINNGNIIVKNNGSLIQLNNNQVTGNGAYEVQRTTTEYREYDYTYWSSPLNNAIINSVFNLNSTLSQGTSTNSDNFSNTNKIYSFNTVAFDDHTDNNTHDDNNNDWVVASGSMNIGQGYIAMGAGADFPFDSANMATGLKQSVKFIGNKVNNGDITIPVVLDGSSADLFHNQNLIGNPYPSAIDGEKFILANSNVGTLYFWTHHTQIASGTPSTDTDAYNFTNADYATFTTAGYAASASGATVPNDKLIASCQGFFADISTAGNVKFTNSMRVNLGNDNFFRPANDNQKNRIWLNMTNSNGLFRQILIAFISDATVNYDRIYDGRRAFNGTNTDFYSLLNNEKFAIQALPIITDSTTIPLGAIIAQTGTYTISIDNFEGDLNNTNVYLKDNLLNITHDLKIADFQFDSTQIEEINNRFEILFSRNTLSTIDLSSSESILHIYQNNSTINLKAPKTIKQVTVYNLLGQTLEIANPNNTETILMKSKFKANTILLIKATLSNGETLTKKWIVY